MGMPSKTSYNKEEEKLLLENLKQGVETAWQEIFDRHHTSLYYIAFHLLKEGDEAKDAVQEVFISLWARREKLDIKGPLRYYLEKAIKFHCLDKLETRKTYHKHLEGYEYLQRDTFAPIQYDNNRELLFQQLATAIQMVAHEPGFNALRLTGLEGKTGLQVARELGKSPGMVKKQKRTMIDKIRRILSNKK